MNGPTRFVAKAGNRSASSSAAPLGLIAGDLLTLVVVTLIGFASHGTLGSAGTRVFSTLVPLLIGWAAAGPLLGAYDRARVNDYRQVWRPAWAMVLAGPFAAVLRGFWLQAPVLPIFAAVMSAVGAAGMLIWRLLYAWITHRTA